MWAFGTTARLRVTRSERAPGVQNGVSAGDAVTSAHLMAIRHEQDAMHRPCGVSEPPPDFDGSSRKGRSEHRRMRLDTPAGRAVIRQDQQPRHGRREPASLACDVPSHPSLSVQAGEQGLQIRHDRLDFDDHQRAGRGIEAENVDGPALAPEIERGLRSDRPTVRHQDPHDSLHEIRVARVQESIETLTLPEQPNVDASAERGGTPGERVNRDAIGASALDPANDGARHPDGCRHLGLRQATAHPERPHAETKANDIHARSIARGPAPGRIANNGRRLSRGRGRLPGQRHRRPGRSRSRRAVPARPSGGA